MWRTAYDKSYFTRVFREKPSSQRQKQRYRFLHQVKQRGKLLEVGCGEGHFLNLARQDFTVSGIDISSYAVTLAQKHIHPSAITLADIEKYTFDIRAYDVIAVFNILEHLKNPRQTIVRLAESLKSNGIIIGSVPNNSGVVGQVATRVSNIIDRTHISTLTFSDWQKIFHQTGLRIKNEFGEIPFGMNFSVYITFPWWRLVSFNYVFVWQKE